MIKIQPIIIRKAVPISPFIIFGKPSASPGIIDCGGFVHAEPTATEENPYGKRAGGYQHNSGWRKMVGAE